MKIIDLKPDEKIVKPGFYRLPLEQHHAQPCEGVSVTSSVLRTLETGTPADVWWTHQLNPNRYEPETREALDMGRAMHAWVEGGEEVLRRDFIVLPPDTPKRPSEAQWGAKNPSPSSQHAMDFWTKIHERQKKTGRSLITQTQFDQIKMMGEALARDETASAVIGGEPEITMAWFDEETQLWVLSRLDNMTFDGLLSDYKKISTQGRPFNARLAHRRITDHTYYMQLALGAEAYYQITSNWPTDCALVFQQDSVPYSAITVAIGPDEIYWGHCANVRARRLFRQCLDSGHWPGPGDELTTYTFAEWQREQYEERQRIGDLPNLSFPGRSA